MKVKELVKLLKDCQKEYGKDFLEWDVYSGQITQADKKFKRDEQKWSHVKDSDDWEDFAVEGYMIHPKLKLFSLNINY